MDRHIHKRTYTLHLSDVKHLSVRYIGPKSRTERPRKTKIGTEVAQVNCDSNTSFKVKRSRSPGRLAHRCVGASGCCSSGRENVLAVGNCCYVAVCSAARGASAPTGEEERGGCISWRLPTYSSFMPTADLFVHGANRLWGESSLGRIVCGVRRPWGKTPIRRNVYGRNILPWSEVSWGERSVGRKVPTSSTLCTERNPWCRIG